MTKRNFQAFEKQALETLQNFVVHPNEDDKLDIKNIIKILQFKMAREFNNEAQKLLDKIRQILHNNGWNIEIFEK